MSQRVSEIIKAAMALGSKWPSAVFVSNKGVGIVLTPWCNEEAGVRGSTLGVGDTEETALLDWYKTHDEPIEELPYAH